MKKTRIVSVLTALAMTGATAASVCAAEPEEAKTNVTISTSVNGNGIVTHYDGNKVVTDTITASDPMSAATSISIGSQSLSAATIGPDMAAQPYGSYLYKVIKDIVYQCMDEYYAEHNIAKPTAAPTETPTTAPTEAPTAAPTEAPTEAPTAAPTETPAAK